MYDTLSPCPNAEIMPNREHGPAQELHQCPFASEINNDFSLHCECCEKCEHECAWDV